MQMDYAQRKLIKFEEEGLSMTRLSAMTGISQGHLWNIKSGRRPCSIENAAALHIGTKGEFNFREAKPKFEAILRTIWFTKKQGDQQEDPTNGTEASTIETQSGAGNAAPTRPTNGECSAQAGVS